MLQANLLSPIVLAFALGVIARLVRSELRISSTLYVSLSIYLLLALGLKGGHELAHAGWGPIAKPAMVTVLLGCITPVTAYFALRRLGNFSVADSAGIAAHYGSVSAVTFLAAQQFVGAMGATAEGFMPTLLALLESPGIHIALGLGVVAGVAKMRAKGVPVMATAAVAGGGTLALLEEVIEEEEEVQPSFWARCTRWAAAGFDRGPRYNRARQFVGQRERRRTLRDSRPLADSRRFRAPLWKEDETAAKDRTHRGARRRRDCDAKAGVRRDATARAGVGIVTGLVLGDLVERVLAESRLVYCRVRRSARGKIRSR